MASAEHYCHSCDTHYGGPPNFITPEEHAAVAHEDGVFLGIEGGDYRKYERRT